MIIKTPISSLSTPIKDKGLIKTVICKHSERCKLTSAHLRAACLSQYRLVPKHVICLFIPGRPGICSDSDVRLTHTCTGNPGPPAAARADQRTPEGQQHLHSTHPQLPRSAPGVRPPIGRPTYSVRERKERQLRSDPAEALQYNNI